MATAQPGGADPKGPLWPYQNFRFFLVLFGVFVWRRRNGGACVLFSTQDVQITGRMGVGISIWPWGPDVYFNFSFSF